MRRISTFFVAAAMLLMTACGQKNNKINITNETSTEKETEVTAETAVINEAAEANAGKSGELKKYKLRIGSLKGPTSMGLVNMMDKNSCGELPFEAEFTMAVTPDEITAKIASGDLDIALIPANLSAVLNQKLSNKSENPEKGITVLNINTLGVIYGVTGNENVKSLEDLTGREVYMTGQGATPEFVFRYILKQNGLEDKVNIIFKNEAAEIAALLNKDSSLTAVLPQPFATVCMVKNENIREFMNLTDEWSKVSDEGSQMVTGVTVIRNKALSELPKELIAAFTEEQRNSVEKALGDIEKTSMLIAEYGIIENASIAKKALSKCNLSCITGDEMKNALSGYLKVLYDADPKSIGGILPDDSFYFIAQ